LPELTRLQVKVAPRRIGDPGRVATVALRAGPVTLKRPRNGFAKTDPETVSMTLVEAREVNPPANEEPLRWRLLTTIAVGDAAAACEIVRARLGGWNCYYKPPGAKTMRAGWAQFATMTAGFTVATALQAESNARIP
jgi:hypothetical protein